MAGSVATRMSVVAALAVVALTLHGCGGGDSGGGGDKPTPAPTPAPLPDPVPAGAMKPLLPLRAVSYESLPNRAYRVGDALPARDMVQATYSPQWSADGRDDLGMISLLGGNAVRTYHSIGLETQKDHGAFLDRAQEIGIHVIPGYHTQMLCPDFNCYGSWKAATTGAFSKGYGKDGKWHPAIAMLVLQETPDYCNFGGETTDSCEETPVNKCWMKAVLSAVDGVLAAEKEMGISAANGPLPNITVVWSGSSRDSIDGSIKEAIGYFGFKDAQVGFSDPGFVGYQPKMGRDALVDAFINRWTNTCEGIGGFDFIQGKIDPVYKQFEPTPWAIMRYDLNNPGGVVFNLASDLQNMDNYYNQAGSYFLGSVLSSFTKDQSTNGTNAGLWNLAPGLSVIEQTGQVCEEDPRTGHQECKKWPVNCLEEGSSQPGGVGASIVASAWQGTMYGRGTWCQAAAGTVVEEQVAV